MGRQTDTVATARRPRRRGNSKAICCPLRPRGSITAPTSFTTPETRKYVSGTTGTKTWDGQYGVATSDRPQGPFTIQSEKVRVLRPYPGDFGLLVDDDGDRLPDLFVDCTREYTRSPSRGLRTTTWAPPNTIAACWPRIARRTALVKRAERTTPLFDYCCCIARKAAASACTRRRIRLGRTRWQRRQTPIVDANRKTIVRASRRSWPKFPRPTDSCISGWAIAGGSHPDNGLMGHDFQCWAPLRFNAAGGIEHFKWVDEWKVNLKARFLGAFFLASTEDLAPSPWKRNVLTHGFHLLN